MERIFFNGTVFTSLQEKAKADSKLCEPIMRCLQKLQEVQNGEDVAYITEQITKCSIVLKQCVF